MGHSDIFIHSEVTRTTTVFSVINRVLSYLLQSKFHVDDFLFEVCTESLRVPIFIQFSKHFSNPHE